MKILRLLVAAIMVCGSIFAHSSAIPARAAQAGDLDSNGALTAADLSTLIDVILTGSNGNAAADVNCDGLTNVSDITSLIQLMLGETDNLFSVPEYQVIKLNKYTKAQLIDRTLAPYESQIPSLTLKAFKLLLGYSSSDPFVYYEAIIRYKSIDHRGRPIDLSGTVSFRNVPNESTACEQLFIDCHATITDNASCPSKAGSPLQMLMTKYAAAVISADYQGYGESSSAIHPYLNEALTARQQIDLVRVALDYLGKDYHVTLRGKLTSYCIGYSQGGAVALATHRMLECQMPDFAEKIGLKGSVCGDGPYSLNKTLNSYTAAGKVSIPVILPMIVRGMMESYPELFVGLELADFFKPSFLNTGGGIMALIDQKKLNIMDYNTLLGASNPMSAKFDLNTIFQPGALTQGSPQLKAMTEAFNRNNCIQGWTPGHHVAFFHSKDDTVVPYANLDDTKAWPSSIYTITKPDVSGVDHVGCAIYFYMAVIKNGPANM